MSRRHKTAEELESIHPQRRGPQGGSSLNSSSSLADSASNHFESINFVAKQENGTTVTFSADKVLREVGKLYVTKIIESLKDNVVEFSGDMFDKIIKEYPSGPSFMDEVIAKLCQLEDEDEKKDEKIGRGRKVIKRLLGCIENSAVYRVFDELCSLAKNWGVDSFHHLNRMLCCFFCALFDTVKYESPYGKITCYYKMMKAHIGDKIPCLKTIQNGINWFMMGWRRDKSHDKEEYNIWKELYDFIMGKLPILEPRLVMC